MSRQIKFRAWDKDAEQMVYPGDGNAGYPINFLIERDGIKVETYSDGGHFSLVNGEAVEGGGVDVLDVHLMQFTGLLDKNGKEIYEGDIIKYHTGEQAIKYEVYYSPSAFYLRNIPDVGSGNHLGYEGEDLEVIGNIYENPELLGGGDSEN